jgi:hypothetical protein
LPYRSTQIDTRSPTWQSLVSDGFEAGGVLGGGSETDAAVGRNGAQMGGQSGGA